MVTGWVECLGVDMADDTLPSDYEEENEKLISSEYSTKSEFSKAILSQEQIRKCLELRSKDMRPGYTTWILDKTGSSKPVIVPDSRKEFISCMEALKNLLAPEIILMKKELEKEYEDVKDELFDKYAYKERIRKEYDDETKVARWVHSKRNYMPHKGQPLPDDDPSKPNGLSIISNPNLWDSKIDAYWDEMLILADILFAELNKLIHTLDYFKVQTGY